jgi:hypothetical protein
MSFFNFFSRFSLLSATVWAVTLHAQIIELSHFEGLKDYVMKPNTLVLVDIDDTCLIPAQTLGTDVWFCDIWAKLEQSGLSKADALEKALDLWQGIRYLTKVKIVEEGSEKIISDIQEKGIPLMCLSTQGLALATCTFHQLLSINIDPSKTAPSKDQEFYFINNKNRGVLYRHGILFTAGSSKGLALETLLKLSNLKPDHIVFINDKATHLLDVENIVEKMGMTFTGLRYSYSDKRVNGYNPEIAKIQFEQSSFAHILSDEEAQTILEKKNSL